MVNNDMQAFEVTETLTPDAAENVSFGVRIIPQATRLGALIQIGGTTLDGDYTIVVETAPEGVPASSDDWMELRFCAAQIGVVNNGFVDITVVQPVLDKVRLRVTNDAVTPENLELTITWLSDAELETLDPTV